MQKHITIQISHFQTSHIFNDLSRCKTRITILLSGLVVLVTLFFFPQHAFAENEFSSQLRIIDVLKETPIEVAKNSKTLSLPEDKKEIVGISTFRFPVEKNAFLGFSQFFSGYHKGIDIRATFNSSVFPFKPGIVSEVSFQPGGYGNYVIVTHEDGSSSLYAHLHKVFVKESDSLTTFQTLGTIGLTGRSTGSHLHFEVYKYSVAVNPHQYLPIEK